MLRRGLIIKSVELFVEVKIIWLKSYQNKQLRLWHKSKLINNSLEFCKFWPGKNCSLIVQVANPWWQATFGYWKSLLLNIVKSLILKSLMIKINLKSLLIFKFFSALFNIKIEIFHKAWYLLFPSRCTTLERKTLHLTHRDCEDEGRKTFFFIIIIKMTTNMWANWQNNLQAII